MMIHDTCQSANTLRLARSENVCSEVPTAEKHTTKDIMCLDKIDNVFLAVF